MHKARGQRNCICVEDGRSLVSALLKKFSQASVRQQQQQQHSPLQKIITRPALVVLFRTTSLTRFFESASTLENSAHVAGCSSSSFSNDSFGVPADSSLICCLINTRSLGNKISELQLMVDMSHFPIIALTYIHRHYKV